MYRNKYLKAATVAIDAAPFCGVLPLPLFSLKAAFPFLGNPANRHRAVPLTYDQFSYSFANAVTEEEASPPQYGHHAALLDHPGGGACSWIQAFASVVQIAASSASRARPRLCGPWANTCTAWGTWLAASAEAKR